MILLIGLVSKNSILLVTYANDLRERGRDAVSAMREAGRIRLRPILMTSVAAVFGALPIALGLGAGAGSRRPLGYSIIGGLLVSTLLTLYLVPAVYVTFERLRRQRTPTSPVSVPEEPRGVRAPISYEPVAEPAATTGGGRTV
jgi:HAE1 family hydrophobic/amphiphilic exporter-1